MGFSGVWVVWSLLGAPGEKKRENQMFLQSPLSGEKKCKLFSSPEKKNIWRGVIINGAFNNLKVPVDLAFQADSGFNVALRVQRRAALAAKVATNA